jgi:hypothetical protein
MTNKPKHSKENAKLKAKLDAFEATHKDWVDKMLKAGESEDIGPGVLNGPRNKEELEQLYRDLAESEEDDESEEGEKQS